MPIFPWWLRLAGLLGEQLERFGAFRHVLSVDSILNEAKRKTCLSDFGDDFSLDALQMLTHPDDDGSSMTLIGKHLLRLSLVECLINRLRIQNEIKRHPAIVEEKIVRPLFIAGMGRTGTTLLQRLLSQDPHCRPLLCWEALHPAPSPDPQNHETDPRITRTEGDVKRLFSVFPQLAAMHYTDARTPEESEWLLQNTLIVPGFLWQLPEFRRYNDWCQKQDRAPAYRYFKLQLQILQKHFPPAHWVLKGNEHVYSLDLLLLTFPDACVVQTHRDPLESLPSNLSLNLQMFGLKYAPTNEFLAESVQIMMEDYAQILERAIGVRKQSDPSRFFDAHYSQLLQDPVGTVRKIYDHFDYRYNDEFESRMIQWLAENPQGKHGLHRYSLEQFGLNPRIVRSRFATYCDYFQV
jgi:sulfotransferase family protein